MKRAIQKPCGLLVLPVLLAALLAPATARAVDYSCTAELPVEVALNGETDEAFTVTITAEEGTPMPEETELAIAGDETGSFTGFTFTEPGDYTYTVLQQAGETEYMTYDDAVYTVVIQVTNAEDGGLTYQIFANRDDNPTEKTGAVRFLNTYAPPTPTASPAPTATPAPTAEPAPEPTPYDPGHPDIAGDESWGKAPTPTSGSGLIPQTSDAMPVMVLVIVAIVAAAAVVVLAVLRKRNGQNHE